MARILVVDDEPLIAMMAEEWLEDLGHTPIGPAHNLHSALELAKSEIDGAIIDVNLGRESGYPVATMLVERGVPFAFATGQASVTGAPEFQRAPILAKPFHFEAFREALNAMLGSP